MLLPKHEKILKKCLLTTCAAFTVFQLAFGAGDSGRAIKIRGENAGNWWVAGDTVTFRGVTPKDAVEWRGGTGTEPLSADSIPAFVKGEITDSSGAKIAEKTIDGQTFAKNGWNWKPENPGFYELKITFIDKDGNSRLITETITGHIGQWTQNGTKYEIVAERDFIREIHNIAVLSAPPRNPSEISSQIGIQAATIYKVPKDLEWFRKAELDLAALIGVNYLRVQGGWQEVEKAEGVYDWEAVDEFYNYASQKGFTVLFNPYGTPRWASSRPELNNLDICVRQYAAYAPAKMKYWTDYLTTLVKRYPKLKKWELWNEPHLPGQSVFWQDSPENFVKVLKAGYECIKKEQSDSTIILGGLAGYGYLPFYDKILQLGAGNYFDVLALHEQWINPSVFHQTEQKYNVPQKPWMNSEFYGTSTMSSTQSEENVARNMLLSWMNQIMLGAESVNMFSIINMYYGAEKETMDFHAEHKHFFHVMGFFRRTPYIEPRLHSVVWRNFIDLFTGKINYREGYYFQDGLQCASLLDSKAGNVLLFWSNLDKSVKIDQELLKAVSSDSILTDWVGRTVKASSAFEITPEKIYFLKNPDMSVVGKWTNKAQVLKAHRKEPTLDQTYGGVYRAGHIFDSSMNIIAPDKLNWMIPDRYVSLNKKEKASGFSAKFAVAVSGDGVDLLVEVVDSKHCQPAIDEKIYIGDSVQFAIDTAGKGFQEDLAEINVAERANGPLMWKQIAPGLKADIPVDYNYAQNPVKFGNMKIEKTDTGLRYKIRIGRAEIYPFAYRDGAPVRFALLVNNNDGNGREGYLEWAGGIGNIKAPEEYGTLTVDVGTEPIFLQKDLKVKAWGDGQLEFPDGSVKVTSPDGGKDKIAMVETIWSTAIKAGGRYKISFMARGNTMIQGMFVLKKKSQAKGERFDFMERSSLDNNWKLFEKYVIIPDNVESGGVSIFCYQQKGFFEIKDFQVLPAR